MSKIYSQGMGGMGEFSAIYIQQFHTNGTLASDIPTRDLKKDVGVWIASNFFFKIITLWM